MIMPIPVGRKGTDSTSRSAIVLRLMVGLLAVVASGSWCFQLIVNGGGHEARFASIYKVEYASSAVVQRRHLSSVPQPPRPQPGGPPGSTCANFCGSVHIPYPFGLTAECARTPYFHLECRNISGLIEGGLEIPSGFWPFLTNVSGSFVNNTYDPINSTVLPGTIITVDSFRVLSIDGNIGQLEIDTTDIKATSCDNNVYEPSKFGNASIILPADGPYRISSLNVVFVVGCISGGQYSGTPIQSFGNETSYGASCGPNVCNNQYNIAYCNWYDCCTMSMIPLLEIYLVGGGQPFTYFRTCGFCSVLYPPTYNNNNTPTAIGLGTYGLLLDYALEVNISLYPNCSSLSIREDYACSENAACQLVKIPIKFSATGSSQIDQSLYGYFCKCTLAGFEGDGYLNSTNCTDIDECKSAYFNECVPEAACNNSVGSYNCTCPTLMRGDGFRNSSGCSFINFCNDGESNDCDSSAECASFYPLNSDYNCTCPSNMVGNGYRVGTHHDSARGTGCKKKLQTALIAGLTAGALVFVIINGLVIWYFYRKRQQAYLNELFGTPDFSRREFLEEIQSKEGANICKLFTLEELSKATNNFSIDGVLGTGGFGTVYEGTLNDGTKLAIKRARHDVGGARDDTKQFINEVTILSQVNHRNLVRLLGCCLETPVPVLVYEFISNGNLQDHLQRPKPLFDENGEKMDPPRHQTLDWNKRMQIAIGTAEALTYLHFGTSPPIYHRDVKTANILLDDKYVAKVADFGLSKFVPLEATHLSTGIQGTPGYLDPEYFDNYQITDKSDVYSFGVVLLELVTAQKPVDLSLPVQDHNIALRCNRLMKHGRLEDIIDPVLGANASSDPKMLEVVHSVAQVAMKCVERHREDRPTMKEVLEQLQFISRSTREILPVHRKEKLRPNKHVTFQPGFERSSVSNFVSGDSGSDSVVSGMSLNSQDYYFSSDRSFSSLNTSGTASGKRGLLELFTVR